MATILLNGVVTDASSISGSELADKLTVSGGVDSLSVDLADGDDAVEIYAASEDVTGTEIRVSEGDDTIFVVAEDGTNNNNAAEDFVGLPLSLGDSLLGGPGEDVIRLEDGLVQLSGSVKGNEDDDTIHVANINGGTVNGNSGNDTIRIGQFAVEEAGSRAANAVSSGSVMGGQGNDTITVDAAVTDSAIRGNEGDDTITIDGDFSGATTVNGNAGDDFIDATAAEGDITIIGGSGDDTLIAGNGQTVRGNLGADTFVVGASGGMFIEDFDKLDLDGVKNADNEDCFCDDEIQLQNITFATHTYDVERVKYTSASSWTGDIKVKAVAGGAKAGDKTTVTLAATKTETLTAKAVARLFITETKTSLAFTAPNFFGYTAALEAALPDVKYTASDLGVKGGFGVTKSGATFANGLARARNTQALNANGAIVGSGIGAAYGQATGYWTQTKTSRSVLRTAYGAIRNAVVATTTKYDKGDFSFLDLTATKKVGVTTNQKLVFSDVTNATVKNHWASYNKVKETNTADLYTMNFGTANFNTVTTGKAFMVVTKGIEDKAYKTTTLDVSEANATAKVTLDLNGTFEAWHKNLNGTGAFSKTGSWDRLTATGNRFIVNGAIKVATGTTVTNGKTGTKKTTQSVAGGDNLSANQLFWTTVQNRGLLTLTTTARNTAQGDSNGSRNTTNNAFVNNKGVIPTNAKVSGAPNFITATTGTATKIKIVTGNASLVSAEGGISLIAGINNTARTKDDFVTNTGRLVMKIAVSETNTSKASKALDTVVKRTTIFGENLTITTCPDFPSVNQLSTKIVDGQAKHGDVTGDFNTRYLWGNEALSINGVPAVGTEAVAPLTRVASQLNDATAGQGFFSAEAFTVDALKAENFGANAITQAAANAQNVPFRVLFFDNDAASNGLYIMSGTANYKAGNLTALNTNPTTSSAMGGKHTIVKVSGGKGSVIELSDINLV